MKARPRFAENKIAELLSEQFALIGIPPVERIPVTGRTGPDISFHDDFPLIVDIKSRIQCPKGYFGWSAFETEDHVGIEMDILHSIGCGFLVIKGMVNQSKIVDDWLKHMDEWRLEHYPQGISAIVLHRPKLPYGKAMLIISQQDRRRLEELWTKQLQSNRQPT